MQEILLKSNPLRRYPKNGGLQAGRRRMAREIGLLLRDRRIAVGLTQDLLASRVGVEPHTVRRWKSGSRLPCDKNMAVLVPLLNLSERDLSGAARRAWETPLGETA